MFDKLLFVCVVDYIGVNIIVVVVVVVDAVYRKNKER